MDRNAAYLVSMRRIEKGKYCKTNNNVNTLAKTGLSDTNGIVALIVVVCGVSAIYSYKKVNDYKKL